MSTESSQLSQNKEQGADDVRTSTEQSSSEDILNTSASVQGTAEGSADNATSTGALDAQAASQSDASAAKGDEVEWPEPDGQYRGGIIHPSQPSGTKVKGKPR